MSRNSVGRLVMAGLIGLAMFLGVPAAAQTQAPGASDVTPAAVTPRVLFYRAGDGVADTGFFDIVGRFTNTRVISGIPAGWTHITAVGDGRFLLYRAIDGFAQTAAVGTAGNVFALQTVGGFMPGWTHIVSTGL